MISGVKLNKGHNQGDPDSFGRMHNIVNEKKNWTELNSLNKDLQKDVKNI
jgi:hypothetical protein